MSISGNVRWLDSRDIMNVKTRERSACMASAMQLEDQPGVLLERIGNAERLVDQRHVLRVLRLGLLDATLDLAHVVEVVRQLRAIVHAEPARSALAPGPRMPSRMLWSSCSRARRSRSDPPSPNSRSNALRGLISIGSGVVGLAHEIVFM